MDETPGPVEWRVDPWTSATVRWGCLLQVALADAGLLVAGIGVLVAFAFAVTLGWIAALVLAGLLVVARGRLVVPLEHWRWRGAVTYLGTGAVVVALAAGCVGYLLALRLVGVGALGLVPVTALVTGAGSRIVGDGTSTGRIDPGEDRIAFGGRRRSLDRIESVARYRLGDLVVVRLRGPREVDDLAWIAVPTADADRVCEALERSGRSDADEAIGSSTAGRPADRGPTTGTPEPRGSTTGRPAPRESTGEGAALPGALTWRRLSTPQIALAVLGLWLAAVGAGAWATIDASGLAAGPLVLIGLGAGFVGGAIAA